jgi:hypothetical protein
MKRPVCDVLASIWLAWAIKAVSAAIETTSVLPRLFASRTCGFFRAPGSTRKETVAAVLLHR